MATAKTAKLNVTKDYRLFTRSDENRPVNLKRHRGLRLSMIQNGFLKCFPIVCRRNENGHLIVIDGQHRLAFAQELGLPVYWVEDLDGEFDVAEVNATVKQWVTPDYAQKYAAKGLPDYAEGLEFAGIHHIPIGTAFALLAGNINISNVTGYKTGMFKIVDRAYADSVASVYSALSCMNRRIKTARFIEACMAVCRVPEFDSSRLIANAERCREKLVPYSTRDAYLDMLEAVYNFGRAKLVGLKAAAVMTMRDRNSANGNGKS